MTAEPNPFTPPEARPQSRPGRSRAGAIRIVLRAVAVFSGFSLIAGPVRRPDDLALRGGSAYAKAIGAALLLAAFIPLGEGRNRPEIRDDAPEEL